jgi:hypothetical protein
LVAFSAEEPRFTYPPRSIRHSASRQGLPARASEDFAEVIGMPVSAQPALIGFNLDQGKDRWASIID